MARLHRARILAAVAILLVAGVAAALVLGRERTYDPDFDTRVQSPAYPAGGPLVLFDEGHLNAHTADGAYRPLADLLRSDGYTLRVLREPLAAPAFQGATVLILAVARGPNDTNDAAAYSEAEEAAVEHWVSEGGSLLLVTDHWPFGSAVASLGRRFGVEMGCGLVEDPVRFDPERGASNILFSVENGLLRDHPIVRGRGPGEQVRRVLSFTGQSLRGPPSAVPFLALSDEATERPPGPARVARDGDDVRVEMQYLDAAPIAGRAQGLALEFGAGRVVVLGEAGMLRAQRESSGQLVGMNVPGYDDRQLALNIVHWLSRLL